MSSVPLQAARPPRTAVLRIYVPIAILAAAIAILGFWESYFRSLVAGKADVLPIIHLHAAVFVGWLLLVIAQATLAATGHKALHVKVGHYGMAWGVLVIVVGIATALVMFASRIQAGQIEQARQQLFVPLTDIMVFAPFLGAAWLYRRRPEIHKRLIIVATTILLIAAVHRMTFILGARPIPPLRILGVWLAPIYLGMIYDFIKHRIIHPVYVLGVGAIVYLKFGRVPLFESQAWDDFSGWLVTLYT